MEHGVGREAHAELYRQQARSIELENAVKEKDQSV